MPNPNMTLQEAIKYINDHSVPQSSVIYQLAKACLPRIYTIFNEQDIQALARHITISIETYLETLTADEESSPN